MTAFIFKTDNQKTFIASNFRSNGVSGSVN